MAKNILWLDDDRGYLKPYVEILEDYGYSVTTTANLLEAEELLKVGGYDLLILDVMIPTRSAAAEALYDPGETDTGYKTGLIFYKRTREILNDAQTRVLVTTVRLDDSIVDEFVQAGLPREYITTKMRLRRSPDFVTKVRALIGDNDTADART
jgi:CheY-like chemotaxis protein